MRRVPISIAFAAAVATAGCASSPRAAATDELSRTSVATQGIQATGGNSANVRMVNDAVAKAAIVDLAPDAAFAALDQAYAALGITLTERDGTTRRLGNVGFRARRRIGNLAMTKIVDCGGDTGMPNAETYETTLTIISHVTPNDAGGSVLRTVVEGTAKNPMTNAANPVRCISVGGLEDRIVELMRRR